MNHWELEKLCRPVVEWLEKNGDPYTTVEITVDHIRVKQEMMGFSINRKGGQSVTHRITLGGDCMAKRKEKEFIVTVEVTEGFSDRLTKGLVDIYYRRKMCAEIEGKSEDEGKD